jgi:hypothetical protein
MTKKEEEAKAEEEAKVDAPSDEEEEKTGAPGDVEDGKIHAPNNEGKKDVNKMFPNAFYCPITKQVLEDPVVIPDGDSYERSAILERGDVSADKLYRNRALQSVIDGEVETSGDSMQAGLMRLQQTIGKSLRQPMEKSVIPTEEFRPLPDAYYCPITFGIIHDPVIDPEGNTFERTAAESWIRVNGNSPITRTSVTVEDLYPNNVIAELLEEEKRRSDDSIHPSIRKWKQEAPLRQRVDPPESPPRQSIDLPEAPPRQSIDPPGLGPSSPTDSNNFLSLPSELEERRAKRRTLYCSFVGVVLLFFLPVLLVLYGGLWYLLFVGAAFCSFIIISCA